MDKGLLASHEKMQAEVRAQEITNAGLSRAATTAYYMDVEARRLAAEKKAAAERQEEQARLDTEAARVKALDAFLLAGGTEGAFSEQWPGIRREQLRMAALSGETHMQRLIADKLAEPDSPYASF